MSHIISGQVEWNCPLSGYTSFAIGGPAEALVTAENKAELAGLLDFFSRRQVAWRVIGKGTNLLIRDEGFAGVIVLLGLEFQQIDFGIQQEDGRTRVSAGGGCGLTRLAMSCMEKGLAGLEFVTGIPGTVGGAVIMNAGAWGSEIASVLKALTVLTLEGERTLQRRDLDFGYRCWHDFHKLYGRTVVINADFELIADDPEAVRRRCSQLQEKRRTSQPKGKGNAGSFFKNPEGDSAGRLIEASGLKGRQVGGAMISEQHANFLVNRGGATSADVFSLMRLVQEKVKEDSGIELDPEVHFI
ncbi:MAG: UDP-N-acetylmuramate dehydrogenase [Desulfoprunum sp.]|nr:UDP-N-acetylmuramate dehydrogenase [Desulfoprunum sp.]